MNDVRLCSLNSVLNLRTVSLWNRAANLISYLEARQVFIKRVSMMFRSIFSLKPIISTSQLWKTNVRSLSTQRFWRTLRRCLRFNLGKPPYLHITQIGDPILRSPALPIEPQVIPLFQLQTVIYQMKEVMKIYKNVGLSAPQIGLPWQIFMIQVTQKHLNEYDKEIQNIRGMELVPLQVFINPTMRTLDHRMISFTEGCGSVRGFQAVVPRAKAVEITALNDKGEKVTVSFKDWTARIVQHEMDHINGILYTDKMDRRTFCCTYWEAVNKYEGNVEIPFDY